jgi:hypothetical protein
MTRQKDSVTTEKPTHFFVKELANEDPPSFETLHLLYELSIEFWRHSPWKVFSDSQLVLAADSKSALCYPPEVLSPEASTADALGNGGPRAIESTRTLPREIRVMKLAFQTALEPLAKQLDCEVRVAKALPALDQVKAALFQHLNATS